MLLQTLACPSKDWTPEYRPHSIVPPTTIKGDRLRKTFMVSAPMITKVGGALERETVCISRPAARWWDV